MAKKLVIGIIGAGYAAHLRAQAVRKFPDDRLKIKGVYDLNVKNSSRFSEEISAQSYTSLEELYADSEINTISVCVPNRYHYEVVKSALENKKNVICEYPLVADDYNKAEELIAFSRKQELFIHVGQTMNFDEDKNIIVKNKNKLGKLFMGYKYLSFGKIGSWFSLSGFKGSYEGLGKWYVDEAERGNWFVAAHYHGIQTFRNVFGEITSVYAVDSSTEEVAAGSVLMKHENGSSSAIQWGMPIYGKAFNLTIVSGANGSIEVNDDNYSITTSEESKNGKLKGTDTFFEDTKSLLDEVDGKDDIGEANVDMLKNLKAAVYAARSSIEEKELKII